MTSFAKIILIGHIPGKKKNELLPVFQFQMDFTAGHIPESDAEATAAVAFALAFSAARDLTGGEVAEVFETYRDNWAELRDSYKESDTGDAAPGEVICSENLLRDNAGADGPYIDPVCNALDYAVRELSQMDADARAEVLSLFAEKLHSLEEMTAEE